METLKDKKKAVIDKFYGGERKVSYHNFDVDTGICKTCKEFIGDATMRMCGVITPEEVAMINIDDHGWD